MNDFFDIELVSVPLAYADLLVSTDKWINYLLTSQSFILERSRCKYFSRLQDFEEYLMDFNNSTGNENVMNL